MANKKITELPLINALSGSQIGGTVLPAVVGGTTNQISIENFSKFVNAYNAHTGSAGNVFSGPQTINNNVTINGRLTVNEVVTQYETASVLFSTGSTKLGDELTDKHEFTGSTNITGSLTYNGVLLINIDANTISRLQQTTQSLQVASASLQSHSASVNAQLLRLQQTTQSLHAATASLQAHSASVDAQLARVYQTTQSLHVATASLNNFTASQDSRNFVISQYTSSTDAHIVGISDFTSSQLEVNLGNAIYTASVNNHIVGISDFTSSQLAVNLGNAIYTASVDSHIVGISTYTASNDSVIARIEQATASIQATTASINSFTSSTNAHIVGISTYTSSNETWKDGVRGELSAIEAWTASLDNTYATDAQLYQLYQATRSLELLSGSMIGITNGLMAFTAALDSTYATDAQLHQLYQATRSIELHSGSMIDITNGLMAYTASNETWKTGVRGEISSIEAWTASLDNTYATDAQLYQLYQATRSIELHSGSMIGITNGLMAYTSSNETWKTGVRGEISAIEAWTASLDNTYATDAQLYQLYAETASMKGEIAGIEAYTASLKSAAIVSSSQQITNYYKFAETASANTFYNNQIFLEKVGVGASTNPVYKLEVSTNGGSERIRVGTLQNNDNTARFEAITSNGAVTANSAWLRVNDGDGFTLGTSGYDKAGGDGGNFSNLSNEVETAVINSSGGNISIVNGNLIFATSGKGIDFSATSNGGGTVTSEVFDDYEYGTFTPIISDAVTGGNTATGTFSGTYTKIGRQVFIGIGLNSITTSGMTAGNIVYIQGLPFTAGANQTSPGVCNFYDVNIGSNNAIAWLNSAVSGTTLRILKQSPTTNSGLIVSDMTSGTAEITLSITYYT